MNLKHFTITLFIIFSSLTNIVNAKSIKFNSSTYEGEVKSKGCCKGIAHGVGIFTFSDGSRYEGEVSRNRIHGIGIYTDAQGRVFEGKFTYGKIKKRIDINSREIIKLNPLTGVLNYFEKKGVGSTADLWFEAKPKTVNIQEIETLKELDIFDTPTIFSADYGDEEKIKEILNLKNLKISIENSRTATIEKNQRTIYEYTSEGQKSLNAAKVSVKGSMGSGSSSDTSSSGNSGSTGPGGC